MKAVGVVSEFNPFHRGHAYLLEQIRASFPEKGIVCVMSGNFVQRGDFAIQEKYSRAACAIRGGADLVLELPFPFSCLSAESFAKSAVSILARIGICDTLAFGSEIADRERLILCARRLASKEFRDALSSYMESHKGVGYPAAREAVYTNLYGADPILSAPNASLALEYLMAQETLGAPFSVFPIERKGEGIRSENISAEFASATAVRRAVKLGEDYLSLLPSFTAEELEREKAEGRFPVSAERLFSTLLYLIKTSSREELSQYYGMASLCDRAIRFAPVSESVEELVEKMKNATVTDSRIRRALLSLLCRIPRYAERQIPAYTLVLAANEKGRRMLSEMRELVGFPVFTKPAHALRSEDESVLRQAETSHLADEIYSMAFPTRQEEAFFLKKAPRIF